MQTAHLQLQSSLRRWISRSLSSAYSFVLFHRGFSLFRSFSILPSSSFLFTVMRYIYRCQPVWRKSSLYMPGWTHSVPHASLALYGIHARVYIQKYRCEIHIYTACSVLLFDVALGHTTQSSHLVVYKLTTLRYTRCIARCVPRPLLNNRVKTAKLYVRENDQRPLISTPFSIAIYRKLVHWPPTAYYLCERNPCATRSHHKPHTLRPVCIRLSILLPTNPTTPLCPSTEQTRSYVCSFDSSPFHSQQTVKFNIAKGLVPQCLHQRSVASLLDDLTWWAIRSGCFHGLFPLPLIILERASNFCSSFASLLGKMQLFEKRSSIHRSRKILLVRIFHCSLVSYAQHLHPKNPSILTSMMTSIFNASI